MKGESIHTPEERRDMHITGQDYYVICDSG